MVLREYKEKDSERIMNLYNETTKKFNIQDLNEDQKAIILFKFENIILNTENLHYQKLFLVRTYTKICIF